MAFGSRLALWKALNGGIFALFSAPIAKLKNVSITANFEKNEKQKKSHPLVPLLSEEFQVAVQRSFGLPLKVLEGHVGERFAIAPTARSFR